MTRLTRALGAGLLVVALAGVMANPASAGRQVERPFGAGFAGTSTNIIEECVAGPMTLTCPTLTTETRIATHLGRAVANGTGSTTLLYAQPCGPNEIGNAYLSVVDVTLVAANGDELHSRDVTSGCSIPGVGATGPVGTYTITGGTGRFEGAAGSGEIIGTVDDGLTTNWSGTLAY